MKSTIQKVPWLRILSEGVVIIVSILFAFAIDAWWAGKGEAEHRKALLRGLTNDFMTAEVDLNRVLSTHLRVKASAEKVLALARSDTPISSEQAPLIDALVSELFDVATFNPPLGTLEAFLASGDFSMLSNDALVTELTAWSSLVDNLQEDELLGVEQVKKELSPYLRNNMIPTLDLVSKESGIDVAWIKLDTKTYQLLTDSRFQSLISDRWFSSHFAVSGAENVRASLKRIQALLDTKLSE